MSDKIPLAFGLLHKIFNAVLGRLYLMRVFLNTGPLIDFATFFCKICDSVEISLTSC